MALTLIVRFMSCCTWAGKDIGDYSRCSVWEAGLWVGPGVSGPVDEEVFLHRQWIFCLWDLVLVCGDFPDGSVGNESACNAGDPSWIPGSRRSPQEGIGYPLQHSWASLVLQLVKNTPAMQEIWVGSLGWEDPLEKGKDTHSSIVVWRIPQTEQGSLSMGPSWCWPKNSFNSEEECAQLAASMARMDPAFQPGFSSVVGWGVVCPVSVLFLLSWVPDWFVLSLLPCTALLWSPLTLLPGIILIVVLSRVSLQQRIVPSCRTWICYLFTFLSWRIHSW